MSVEDWAISMFDKNRLTIVRGNSAVIDITPIDEGTKTPIRLNDGDKVLFTIKSYTGGIKLQKILTNNDYSDETDDSLNCIIEPDDTINWNDGEYQYDCLLIRENGTANTFISSTIRIEEAFGVYTDAG